MSGIVQVPKNCAMDDAFRPISKSTLNSDSRQLKFTHHLRQGGWSIAESLAFPILMFLATPIFLNTLGPAQYGQWMLLLTFNGLGGLAGLGMGASATKEVSANRGRRNSDAAVQAVRTSLAATLSMSLVLATILILIGLTIGPSWLSKAGDTELIQVLFIAGAVLITLEQIDLVFASTIKGFERFDLSAKVEIASRLFLIVASLVAAVLTENIIWVIGISIVVLFGRTIFKYRIVRELMNYRSLTPSWDREEFAKIFGFGKWLWLQGIAATAFSTVDRFMIAAVLGASALAQYTICLQIAQQIQTVPAAAAQLFFPKVSKGIAANVPVARLAIRGTLLFVILTAVIAAPVAVLGETILKIWVGPEIALNSGGLLLTLILAFSLLALCSTPHFVLLGLGKSRSVALLNVTAGGAALCLTYWGVTMYGVIGAAYGRAGFAVIICFLIPMMLYNLNQQYTSSSGVKDV